MFEAETKMEPEAADPCGPTARFWVADDFIKKHSTVNLPLERHFFKLQFLP